MGSTSEEAEAIEEFEGFVKTCRDIETMKEVEFHMYFYNGQWCTIGDSVKDTAKGELIISIKL